MIIAKQVILLLLSFLGPSGAGDVARKAKSKPITDIVFTQLLCIALFLCSFYLCVYPYLLLVLIIIIFVIISHSYLVIYDISPSISPLSNIIF